MRRPANLTTIRREVRAQLAKRRRRESERLSLDIRERNEFALVRSFLQDQAIWFVIMMLKLLAEACLNEFTFPGFWRLMYIWDDYIPILYISALSRLRKYVSLKGSVTAVTFIGYLPVAATTLWYPVDVYYHTIDFGFPLIEDYPLGIVWWVFLMISHFLRCKTIHAFLGLLSVWRLQQKK